MKAGFPVSPLCVVILTIVAFTLPFSAWGSSYDSSTTVMTGPGNSNPSAQDQSPLSTTTTTTTTSTENNSSSWEHSATEAAHNAKLATENAYNQVARSIRDISLEGKIKTVLHETKATRDSDVHVFANNGIVTLTGAVPSARSAQQVQEVVADVYGVKVVNNELYYPNRRERVTPPDADATGVARPAYSDTAPAERAPQ
jgi:BON domain